MRARPNRFSRWRAAPGRPSSRRCAPQSTASTTPWSRWLEVLRLARTQFDVLSAGFARKGDVISQAMSEIGGFAIDEALMKKTADKA